MKIRNLLLILSLALGSLLMCARTPGDKVGVSLSTLSYDFGNVPADGPNVVRQYELTNTGTGAVAIISARASCGCTEPSYPRQPIMPGQSATITLTFVPLGQRGEVDKVVNVKLRNAAGTTEKITLRLHGTVTPAN